MPIPSHFYFKVLRRARRQHPA